MKSICIYLFLFKSMCSFAHPHVFLDVMTEPQINKNIIKGITFTIRMDEMNTVLFSEIYDLNGDKIISNNEFIKLADENLSGIKGNKSHFHIKYGDLKIPINTYLIKNISIDKEKLIFKIFIPLNIEIKVLAKLNIAIYDPDYYYDYSYSKSSFSSEKIKRKFKFNFIKNKKKSYYMGNLNPLEYEVIF
ncbi:MAG: DUF1007 family protein [Psychrilyobacter sp.]|uniref:DUF1007 family protein n=1 Tax=Psychrilyobacter sp. TaxID=2586924 RepID=UPI003C73D563